MRTYRLYVPSHLGLGPVPLLVAFHGGGGWAQQFEKTSGFNELAEANGFIVVYPEGVGSGPTQTTTRTWNAYQGLDSSITILTFLFQAPERLRPNTLARPFQAVKSQQRIC